MTSIAKMPPAEAAAACEALLRYCELDTLAMVKVWEKWTQFSSCPRGDAGANFFQLFSNF